MNGQGKLCTSKILNSKKQQNPPDLKFGLGLLWFYKGQVQILSFPTFERFEVSFVLYFHFCDCSTD